MPTPETLITKALHDRADSVTAASLRYPDFAADRIGHLPPAPRRLTSRVTGLAAASVVAVLAIAIGVSVLRPDGHHPTAAGGGDPLTMLVGKHWHLSDVRTTTKRYPIPAGYRAELSFATHGRVTGLDGPNALAGSYRISANKITIHITEAGTAGSTRTFPAAEAMASVYTSRSLTSDSVTSTYTLVPDSLTLNTGRWTVTFGAETSIQSEPSTITPRTSPAATSPATGKPTPRGQKLLGLVRSATRTATGYRVALAPATRQRDGQFVAIPGRAVATYLIPTAMVPDGGLTLTGPIEVTVDRGHVTALTIVGG